MWTSRVFRGLLTNRSTLLPKCRIPKHSFELPISSRTFATARVSYGDSLATRLSKRRRNSAGEKKEAVDAFNPQDIELTKLAYSKRYLDPQRHSIIPHRDDPVLDSYHYAPFVRKYHSLEEWRARYLAEESVGNTHYPRLQDKVRSLQAEQWARAVAGMNEWQKTFARGLSEGEERTVTVQKIWPEFRKRFVERLNAARRQWDERQKQTSAKPRDPTSNTPIDPEELLKSPITKLSNEELTWLAHFTYGVPAPQFLTADSPRLRSRMQDIVSLEYWKPKEADTVHRIHARREVKKAYASARARYRNTVKAVEKPTDTSEIDSSSEKQSESFSSSFPSVPFPSAPYPSAESHTTQKEAEPAQPSARRDFPLLFDAAELPMSRYIPPGPEIPVAKLAHNLERVLFNPGVHFLRDPRSGVYNFSPTLENLPKLEEFAFEKLPRYMIASEDRQLEKIAEEQGKKYVSSTSSSVSLLCHIYFWLSDFRPVNLKMLSSQWSKMSTEYSMAQRLPFSGILRKKANHFALDADKSSDVGSGINALAQYGHLMEKLLTTEPDEFTRFLKDSDNPAPSEVDSPQAYAYLQTDKLMLRSQLDAHHELLPNVTFDVKTRGTAAIRHDRLNYEAAAEYDITKLRGKWQSFEAEYYDLIRSAFLKYQFQARIGDMDGVIVAYHTTNRFAGFSYIPLNEMDEALFSSTNTGSRQSGDSVFRTCVGFLEIVLDECTACYEGREVGFTACAEVDGDETVLRVFVEPISSAAAGEVETDGRGRREMTMLEFKTSKLKGDALPVGKTYYGIEKQVGYLEDPGFKKVANLYKGVKDLQKIFNSLVLPVGVSLGDVRKAQDAARGAEMMGVGELLSSDLAVRFPVIPGLTYSDQPTKKVRELRQRAEAGRLAKEKLKTEEKEEGGMVAKRYQIRSTLDVVD